MRILTSVLLTLSLFGCGVAYQSPAVRSGASDGAKVRVIPLTPESVLIANRSTYRPQSLPAAFRQTAGNGGAVRGAGALPSPASAPQTRPLEVEARLPPPPSPGPYHIGVGDVVLLSTPQTGTTVEELAGLLAAQNRRQGYTVQDDGAIAIPDVGRIAIAGMTLEDAEAALFQRLVEHQISPSFSLEIAEFNSRRVSVGGAVKSPAVVSVTLTPLYLDEALAAAGGLTARDRTHVTIRLLRDGTLYRIPASNPDGQQDRIRLIDGDRVFVDTGYDLEQAQTYFEEQIRLSELRQSARQTALQNLSTEIALRRAELAERRETFQDRIELDAVGRDYVYLTGEVGRQSRVALPFDNRASLADAIYGEGGGIPTETANVGQIYVLRGSTDPREFSAVTAWHLDARNVANMLLATRFELRPNDIVFVAEQPVTKWGRVVRQITPSLITSPIVAAAD
ncbi:polysaccharide biosynthesis/export family protein [Aliiroseovarius sp. YM-037]|uniref:polysaccharide biosynthesis/export family protein n=1 Tax=Aliiroseovarius sp. YM-037 TaxID=3341728 RepID=UPI003A800B50